MNYVGGTSSDGPRPDPDEDETDAGSKPGASARAARRIPRGAGRMPRGGGRVPLGVRPAPVLAAAGLLVVALVTVGFWQTPLLFGTTGGRPKVEGRRTPTPSNVVLANQAVSIPGELAFIKGGNVWIISGTTVRQVTATGNASMPAWSPDGQRIYFIETRSTTGRWPPQSPSGYDLNYPVLVRIHPDGTGKTDVLSSLIDQGNGLKFFYWLREPSISPDGRTAAVISDGPSPDTQDTMLGFVDLTAGKLLMPPRLPETAPLGHANPSYSPDGSRIAFVMEGRTPTGQAQPSIWTYDVATGKAKQLSAIGYRFPSWSPDGRYMAATRDIGQKLDVVILDATTGHEAAEVTADGASFMPIWSPAGDSLVYIHQAGPVSDLHLARFTASNGTFHFEPDLAVTEFSGVEQTSRPAWYIPGR